MRSLIAFFSLTVIVLMSTLPAESGDKWVLYATDRSSRGFIYKYFYDTDSITRPSSDVFRLWLRYGKYDMKDNLLRRGKTYNELNCKKMTVTQIENIVTFSGGESVNAYQNTLGEKVIKAGTTNEDLYSVLCNGGKKTVTSQGR